MYNRSRESAIERRAWIGGLTASTLLHVLVFLGAPQFRLDTSPESALPIPAANTTLVDVMTVLSLIERNDMVESPSAGHEPSPLPQLQPLTTATPASAPFDVDRVANSSRTDPSLMNRFGPRNVRLWIAPDSTKIHPPGSVNFGDNANASLDAFNDSIVTDHEAARKAVDWSVTNDEGERWGYSPGRTSLGSTTLPISFELVGNSTAAQRMRDWNHARWQAAVVQVRREIIDRAKAIRDRRRLERRPPSLYFP